MPYEPYTYTATMRGDPVSHYTWLEFATKPDEDTIARLRRNGWRWASYRKQWYTADIAPYIPANVTTIPGGYCDYASERAERLLDRASKHASNAAHARAKARASMIPFGQPIMVGHHSERRHRSDLAKIERDERKGYEEAQTAERLSSAAERSQRHQDYKRTAPAMKRRADRLNTEIRQLDRILASATSKPSYERSAAWEARLGEKVKALRANVAELEKAIADAGGIFADSVQVRPGDLVNLRGFPVRVTRVNPKTYSGVIEDPNTPSLKGWRGKWDRTDLRAIIERADGDEPAEPEAEQ